MANLLNPDGGTSQEAPGTGTAPDPQALNAAPGGNDDTPDVAELQAQVAQLTKDLDEWKGHARTHEGRAKANKDAADKVTELETKLAAASAATTAAVRDALIKAHGLDDKASALLTAADLEGLQAQIDSITALRGAAAPGASAPLEGTRPADNGGSSMSSFAKNLFASDDA